MKKQTKNHRMKALCLFMASCSFLVMTTSCSENDPEPLPDSTASVVITQIPNGNFEDGTNSWSISGDKSAACIVEGSCEGAYALAFESAGAHTVSAQQTVEGLEDGTYDLEFYYKNSGGQAACYIAAGSDANSLKMTSLQVAPTAWIRSYIRGIEVKGGKCTIQINTQSANAAWSRFDNLCLIKTEKEFTLLKGGDISELTYVEQNGGKYYSDGKEKDCIEILKENGFNIVRLRLYNDPGNPDYSPSNRLPADIQSQEDILRLAKRAKDAGMQIQLTFHYSDYWTNGKDQIKPHQWEELDFKGLKQALYDFTFEFMTKMAAQGTTPEYVALGNETQGGMLYPEGSYEDFAQLSELYNTGYEAVKAVSKESKVIIHLDGAGNKDQYNWYFGELKNRGTQYDIIGASYYPFYTKLNASQMREWADYISAKFDKDILIMETGYKWNPTLPDGKPGQLADNGPYKDCSRSGQKNFMLELIKEIKQAKDCRILGFLYWDPIFIEASETGWELGADNVVSNAALFDFNGNAMEVFDAFKYNN